VSEIGSCRLFAFGSGKKALKEVFRFLKNNGFQTVALGAYTCPDIAAAAAAASLRVRPIDIEGDTLEMSPGALPENWDAGKGALLLSNLYGLPDAVSPWRGKSTFIVDDACQAMLSRGEEGHVGCRSLECGVLSFGRGKALSGVGGGALLVKGGGEENELVGRLKEHFGGVRRQRSSFLAESNDFFYGLVLWMLERPWLYWLPNSLPFLGIGETRVKLPFECKPVSQMNFLHMISQLSQATEVRAVCAENAKLWHEHLSGAAVVEPFVARGFKFDGAVVPIRYPLLLPDKKTRDEALRSLHSAGLGASQSYPRPLSGYRELEEVLLRSETPVADDVSDRIVTLPVHRYVQAADIERGAELIRKLSPKES